MHEHAVSPKSLSDESSTAQVRGAIHILTRVFPLLFEDKDLLLRAMWREQAFFNNQINALLMMEAISLLLFKPGFTIGEIPDGL